ncbi:two-component system, chemotaxis family, response regulator CheY [Tindallia magadiensis]|uniref:Stage 0 sporulation protein A homolog n=1 Tax=Tindallia magadiensis TaxID=69895 RepID=A0A1I3ANI6_9FIRM|nr:response regulator [Tindallia magadiensis]SFH51584.1 two-component system, chemotaxis family, response regulator CheY [Tindallia magadiensis]
MKILSVDDSAIVRKIIRGAVEVLNYDLLEASDGVEGKKVLENHYEEIGLLLLDWNMPGMNGMDLLKIIKEDEKYTHIPVMMVTTESEKENIVRAIKAGADHYVVKPFTMEELIKKILECLGQGDTDE